jgi:hypothetical protein
MIIQLLVLVQSPVKSQVQLAFALSVRARKDADGSHSTARSIYSFSLAKEQSVLSLRWVQSGGEMGG